MDTPAHGLRRGAILPAPACDLLDRLTAELNVGFTLTDLHGAVVASTAGQPAGRLDRHALHVLENGPVGEAGPSGASPGGFYLPVRLSGRIAGVLAAHGEGPEVAVAARVAAVAIGLALDFAEAASSLGRENVNPGWLLYRLLRGSRHEAQQARVVAAVYGWNLYVPRIAVVVVIPPDPRPTPRLRHRPDPQEVLRHLLGAGARTTPYGQIDEAQWVVLPGYEPAAGRERVRELAERIHSTLTSAGYAADVGIGEPHPAASPVPAVRRSYREAVYAARQGARFQGEAGVHELRSLGSAAFFAPSSPSRRNLAALVLEPLREHPLVLETLQSYLESDMSVAATAAKLDLHRHTVRNHLARVFGLTGLDPRTLDGAVQLKLALLVAASDPDVDDR